jgi:hypothetical protein
MIRLLLCLLFCACSVGGFAFVTGPTPQGLLARGKTLFYTSELSGSGYTCRDCHAELEDDDNLSLLPGHSLYNVAVRPSWYNGSITGRAVQAAERCLSTWMQGALSGEEDREALQAYLASLSPARKAPRLIPKPVPSQQYTLEEIAEVMRAEGFSEDLARGRLLTLRACEGCHQRGRGIAPPLAASDDLAVLIRSGRGAMPPFPTSRLSEADLAAITRYLREKPVTP